MHNKIDFDTLPTKVQLLCYLKMSYEHLPEAIFCTSNPSYHSVADDLISEGLIVEVEGPGGADKAYALTSAGKEHLNIK